MATLSNEKKDSICRLVIERSMRKKTEELEAMKHIFAFSVYRSFVSEENEGIMNNLPMGFFSKNSTLRYNIGSSNSCFTCTMVEERLLPYTMAERWGGWDITGTPAMAQYAILMSMIKKHSELIDKIRSRTREILNSVRTTKQLESVWPQGGKYYLEFLDKPQSLYLPAIIIDDLNNMLDTLEEDASETGRV